MKRCSACGVEKPLDEFHLRRRSPDGREAKCRPCRNAYESARQRYVVTVLGRCRSCGKRKLFSTSYCRACLILIRERNRERIGAREWSEGEPGRPPLEVEHPTGIADPALV